MTAEAPPAWRSRIVRRAMVPPKSLISHPRNWRLHPEVQATALASAMEGLGWLRDIIVSNTTGHIIDGHLRLKLALEQDLPGVPVAYVDLSPEEEHLALATFDPLGALSVVDQSRLDELLARAQGRLPEVADVEGSGINEGLTPVERKVVFDGSDERAVGIHLSVPEQRQLLAQLDALRDGEESNSDLVLRLLRAYASDDG